MFFFKLIISSLFLLDKMNCCKLSPKLTLCRQAQVKFLFIVFVFISQIPLIMQSFYAELNYSYVCLLEPITCQPKWSPS